MIIISLRTPTVVRNAFALWIDKKRMQNECKNTKIKKSKPYICGSLELW